VAAANGKKTNRSDGVSRSTRALYCALSVALQRNNHRMMARRRSSEEHSDRTDSLMLGIAAHSRVAPCA